MNLASVISTTPYVPFGGCFTPFQHAVGSSVYNPLSYVSTPTWSIPPFWGGYGQTLQPGVFGQYPAFANVGLPFQRAPFAPQVTSGYTPGFYGYGIFPPMHSPLPVEMQAPYLWNYPPQRPLESIVPTGLGSAATGFIPIAHGMERTGAYGPINAINPAFSLNPFPFLSYQQGAGIPTPVVTPSVAPGVTPQLQAGPMFH